MGGVCGSDTTIGAENKVLVAQENSYQYKRNTPEALASLVKRRAENGRLTDDSLAELKNDMRLPQEPEFYNCFKEGNAYREADLVVWLMGCYRGKNTEKSKIIWDLFDTNEQQQLNPQEVKRMVGTIIRAATFLLPAKKSEDNAGKFILYEQQLANRVPILEENVTKDLLRDKPTLGIKEWTAHVLNDVYFTGLMDSTSVRQKLEDTPYMAPKLQNGKNAFMAAANLK